MRPRLRRLSADHERVSHAFAGHRHIAIAEVEGEPPERYVFTIEVAGLVPMDDQEPAPSGSHRAEVFLPLDYPQMPPFCRMLTPVFHPNISPQKICIGDHWSADQALDRLVVRIAEMICFQSYNTKSPLNAVAAAWTETHLDRLPLLAADLHGTS